MKEAIGFAGNLITMSESPLGHTIRFATGLPALMGGDLMLMGAKALSEDAYALVDLIVNEPIESERYGRFSHRPLRDRNLFHSGGISGLCEF